MRNVRIAPLVAISVLLGGLGAAVAQTPTRDHPFPEIPAARHWGPFLVDPRIVIDNIGYDGNVFLVSSEDTTRRPESDFIVRFGPDVRGQASFGRRLRLTVHDKLGAEVYRSHHELNHLNNEFEGQFDALLGPVLLTTSGRLASIQERPWSEITEPVRETHRGLKETARLFIGPFTDVSVFAGRTSFRYSDPADPQFDEYTIDPFGNGEFVTVRISEALNRDQTSVGGEIGWRPRPRTRLFFKLVETKDKFIASAVHRDTDDRRRLVGVEFSPSSILSGRAAIGRARLENVDPDVSRPSYEGTVAEASLVWRPTGTTRIIATGERQLYFSTYEQNFYYVSTSRALELNQYLGAFWGVTAGAGKIDADYPLPNTISEPGVRRRDRSTDVFGGVLFRMKGGFEIGLRFGHRRRESNIPRLGDDQRYFSTTGSYVF